MSPKTEATGRRSDCPIGERHDLPRLVKAAACKIGFTHTISARDSVHECFTGSTWREIR